MVDPPVMSEPVVNLNMITNEKNRVVYSNTLSKVKTFAITCFATDPKSGSKLRLVESGCENNSVPFLCSYLFLLIKSANLTHAIRTRRT